MARVYPNVTQFVQQYYDPISRMAAGLGVPVEALLGQIGVETQWGKKILPGTNNLTNIKEFGNGPSIRARDNGYESNFKKYNSVDDWARDHASLIRRRYANAIGAPSAQAYAEALQNGQGGRRYAENPNYVHDLATGASMVQASMGQLGLKYNPAAGGYTAPAGQPPASSNVPQQYFTPEPTNGFMDNLQGKSGVENGDISPVPLRNGLAANNYNPSLDLNALGGNIGDIVKQRFYRGR